MGELIFFVVAAFEIDKYAEVMNTGCDSDGRSGEFGGELVKAVSGDLL